MKESEFTLLLSKRFSGEISPEQSAKLDEWLHHSPENRQFATDMQRIWEKADGYGGNFSPNLDADFQKVQARIRQAAPTQLRFTLGQKLMRAAAVLVLALASIWGWQQFASNPAAETMVAAENSGFKTVALPDGSNVWLREGSRLIYAANFAGQTRQVKLQGEGYFEVEHDPAHPFKVELELGGTVEVLGTQFNVCQTADHTSVVVRSGKVRFSPAANTEGPVLTANQKAVFNRAEAQVRVSTLSSLNELSWQTGGLEFVNTPLSQVVRDLEQYYGVKITLGNEKMLGCPHSAPLTSQPIEKVLETLALTHELKVKKLDTQTFELNGGTCR